MKSNASDLLPPKYEEAKQGTLIRNSESCEGIDSYKMTQANGDKYNSKLNDTQQSKNRPLSLFDELRRR